MITTRRSVERGQILIITGAAMLVLLLISALVVDLGFSWMLRRQEQNAADPAAIAAARWLKDQNTGLPTWVPDEAYRDACFYAKQNGFFQSDDDTCSSARATGDFVVVSPPTTGPYSARPGFVQVKPCVRRTRPSSDESLASRRQR